MLSLLYRAQGSDRGQPLLLFAGGGCAAGLWCHSRSPLRALPPTAGAQVAAPVEMGDTFTFPANLDGGYAKTQFYAPGYDTGVVQWDSRIEIPGCRLASPQFSLALTSASPASPVRKVTRWQNE